MSEQSQEMVLIEQGPEPQQSPSSDRIIIAVTPLLVNATTLGQMLGLSKSSIHKMDNNGELGPVPVKLGGRRLWRTEEISRWVMAGCLGRSKWMDSAEGREAQGRTRKSEW